MKKFIGIILCLVLIISLGACGKQKNSSNPENDDVKLTFSETVNSLSVGETFEFGSYEQDAVTSNGKEKVEWIVLAKEPGKVLVISKKVLDINLYNTVPNDYENTTWEISTLRQWLNYEFYNECFSLEEKSKIPSTIVVSETISSETFAGNTTQDKVFVLSYTEANQYLTTDELKIAYATDYAKSKKDKYYLNFEDKVEYFLRTPGFWNQYMVCTVEKSGKISNTGEVVQLGLGIRPAIWIQAID